MGENVIWCLHGAVGEPGDWADLRGRLAADSEAMDLHGFLEERDCSFEELAEQLCEKARRRRERPVLLGYSLGGRLALHAIKQDPNCWKGALLVSAHPGLEAKAQDDRIARMAQDAEWAAMLFTGGWECFLERWNAQPTLAGKLEIAWGDRFGLARRHQAVARSFVNWSLGRQEDFRAHLPQWNLPVWWLTGGRDEKFTELGQEAVGLLPNGAHVIAEASGHRLPWESPAWFAGQVEAFLESLGDEGARH